ncbi:MAG: hypothetical protein RLZZ299_1688 [Pseudomonadota bacterium]
MQTERTEWRTSPDGFQLRVVRWGAPDSPEVLILHGLAEHAGRYRHVAEAFVARGWSVRIAELRGHGKSHGRRGHVDAWQQYVDDVVAVRADMAPDSPVVAHSMGGLVALEALRVGAIRPSRLALSNPLLALAFEPAAWKTAAAGLLSRLLPTVPIANEVDPSWLSRDEENARAYATDPLVFHAVTPRWFVEMLAAAERVRSASVPVPMAVFLGDDDRVNSMPVNRAFAEARGAAVTVYPGMRHELFNEIGREQVLADVAGWLEGASAGSSAGS